MEIPSEAVRVLYGLHESNVRVLLQQEGFSYEDAFWIDFATLALMPWDDAGETQIRLSEIFKLYLTIYCEKIDKSLKVEDESAFLEELAEKYYSVEEILFGGGDTAQKTLLLGRAVLGERTNHLYLWVRAAQFIIFVASEVYDSSTSIGIRLVKDVLRPMHRSNDDS